MGNRLETPPCRELPKKIVPILAARGGSGKHRGGGCWVTFLIYCGVKFW